MNRSYDIGISTHARVEFIDITQKVKDAVAESGVRDGIALISCNHTTACVRVTEKCERLEKDMTAFLNELVPEREYLHDADTVDNRPNARSHIMALFLNSSECLPIENGKLAMGTWQSLFFVELDGPRQSRSVKVKVVG